MKDFIVNQLVVASLIKDDNRVPVSLENGFILSLVKERNGVSFFDIKNAYLNLIGSRVCLNEDQLKCLSPVPVEVKADSEMESKDVKQKYTLNPDNKYSGDEGIDYIILFLQNNDLSGSIARDDSNSLFVDLGELSMFPDAENRDWIMKLNSRIPLRSAMSAGCRVKKGVKHFGIVLHDNFV